MKSYMLGHLLFEHNGNDLKITCTKCKYHEDLKDYSAEGGEKEKMFTVLPFCKDGMQYIKCEKCGELYEAPSVGR